MYTVHYYKLHSFVPSVTRYFSRAHCVWSGMTLTSSKICVIDYGAYNRLSLDELVDLTGFQPEDIIIL